MERVYQELLRELDGLLNQQDEWFTSLANSAALLFTRLEGLNWAGFYLVRGSRLVLGPFQGKPACTEILKGRGVCGTAWEKKEVVRVLDVHQFAGHIACDSRSASEIVLPLIAGGEVAAVLDLDSPLTGRFTSEDEEGLRNVARLLEKRICLPSLFWTDTE